MSQTFRDISNASSFTPIRSVLNCRLESRKAAHNRKASSDCGTSDIDYITRKRVVDAKSPSWRRAPWPPNSSSSTFNITE
ncbi:hypothetical protein TSUD_110370 [Trifolium subterraneum]|uniref:Uncharacterized protein n=1 Tax=Trifolium subterraneum TaxID=3900 RepID=A0A2Z6LIY8_TRISU|nr:hypothetical protein TSUD_110370 [Trifolium subterraneum]